MRLSNIISNVLKVLRRPRKKKATAALEALETLAAKPDLTKVGVGVFVRPPSLLPEDHTDSDDSTSSAQSNWKSAGLRDHNKDAPLIARSPDDEDCDKTVEKDAKVIIEQIVLRSKQLPTTWYYSSNHIMINQERTKRMIAPLTRLKELDEVAREHAEAMAAADNLFHTSPSQLHARLGLPARRLGVNVASGKSIREIHAKMMLKESGRNNVLDSRFTHMGMATARGPNGILYLAQVFRG